MNHKFSKKVAVDFPHHQSTIYLDLLRECLEEARFDLEDVQGPNLSTLIPAGMRGIGSRRTHSEAFTTNFPAIW